MPKKTKKSKLQKKKDNPKSTYWCRKADGRWTKRVRKEFGDKCAVCGDSPTQAHHLINRSVRELRHVMMNGIALCPSHHKFNRRMSAHGGPVVFAWWLWKNHPMVWDWIILNKDYVGIIDYEKAYEKLK